jgi:hypothetical protein
MHALVLSSAFIKLLAARKAYLHSPNLSDTFGNNICSAWCSVSDAPGVTHPRVPYIRSVRGVCVWLRLALCSGLKHDLVLHLALSLARTVAERARVQCIV